MTIMHHSKLQLIPSTAREQSHRHRLSFDLRQHLIKGYQRNYIKTADQPAYLMTKPFVKGNMTAFSASLLC